MWQVRRHRSLEFLNRIRGEGPRGSIDDSRIRKFAVNERTRVEHPLNRRLHVTWNQRIEAMEQDFRRHGLSGHPVRVFESGADGLKASGWSEIPIPGGHVIGEGGFGLLKLAYKFSESGVPLESRHLSAVKIQPKGGKQLSGRTIASIWKEIDILRAVVHENVIDYFSHFVTFSNHVTRTGTFEQRMSIWIVMEYASAGDMEREIERYTPDPRIPESGARFYALQVADGLSYLHSKSIAHEDLHGKNVLLKYNADGSKTCMLADFGESVIGIDGDPEHQIHDLIRADIVALVYLIDVMVKGYDARREPVLSPELQQLFQLSELSHDTSHVPHSVHQLVHSMSWFQGRVRAPIPGRNVSPVLNDATIGAIGYLPAVRPTSGWSVPQRTRPRSESAPPLTVVTHSIPRRHISSSPRSSSRSGSMSDSSQGRRRSVLETIPSAELIQEPDSPDPASRMRSPDLRAAASAAVDSGLREENGQQSIGRRIRRSFSHMTDAVSRRVNCFRRNSES